MPIKLKLSTKRNYTKKKSTKLKGGWGENIAPMKPIEPEKKSKKGKKGKKVKKNKKKQNGGWGGKPRFYTSN